MARKPNVNDKIRDLEQRVKRKLSRLKRRGINTGAIDPRKSTASMSLAEKHAYERHLWFFMDKRFAKGKDGTPIDRMVLQQIEYARKKVNKDRQERYGAQLVERHGALYKKGVDKGIEILIPVTDVDAVLRPIKERKAESYTSIKHAQDYLARLNKLTSKEYIKKRDEILMKNILDHLGSLSDNKQLKEAIKNLSIKELQDLYTLTNFVEWMFIDTPPKKKSDEKNEPEDLANAVQFEGREQTLIDALESIGITVD